MTEPHKFWHGDLLHPCGALRPDRTIDEAVLEQQARIKARTLCDDKKRVEIFGARGLSISFDTEYDDALVWYRQNCERRIDYLNWLDQRDAEEAKGPLHAAVVELQIALAILENSDHKPDGTFEAIRSASERLTDAIHARDVAERGT